MAPIEQTPISRILWTGTVILVLGVFATVFGIVLDNPWAFTPGLAVATFGTAIITYAALNRKRDA